MTELEQAVIERAVDIVDDLRALRYGNLTYDFLQRALDQLEEAVIALHQEHDGRWSPQRKEGIRE